MTKDEALKMAIEEHLKNYWNGDLDRPFCGRTLSLLIACKEALQSEASEQEPVAYQRFQPIFERWIDVPEGDVEHYKSEGQTIRELFTRPTEFKTLTDEEIQELTHDGVADEYDIKFARAVLAKAKEKNYYGPT